MPEWMPWLMVPIAAGLLLTLVVYNLFSTLRGVLGLILSALFVSFALEPAVNFLARRGWRRGAGTGLTMFAVAVVATALAVMVVPTFISELANLIGQLPAVIVEAADELGLEVTTTALEESLAGTSDQLKEAAAELVSAGLSLTGWVVSLIGNVAAVALLAFYLTADAPRVRATVCSFMPQERQQEILRLWEIAIEKVGAYLYSRLVMGALSGTATYIVLRILEVPFAAPLAIFEGFASQFVPIIGTYLGYAVPVIVALASQGPRTAVILIIFASLYQALENFLISPLISARTMVLHPAIAYVSALIGSALGGAMGAFVALPVAAIVQAFTSTFWTRHEVVASELTTAVDPDQAKAEWLRHKQERDTSESWLERMARRVREANKET